MVQKPKIQYVGQFYVHGSEARQLELEQQRKAKTRLPLARLQKIQKLYVDPVAVIGITVAIFMLVVMTMGTLQLQEDWDAYQRMSGYVDGLRYENAQLEKTYREGYELKDIETKALALGLVPKEELQSVTIAISLPEKEPVPSKLDEIKWFLEGLFA